MSSIPVAAELAPSPVPSPSAARSAFFRGKRCLGFGALARARSAFEAAVQAAPDNGCYLAWLAWTRYLDAAAPSLALEARHTLERVLETRDGREPAAYFLGRIALEANAPERAAHFFRLALLENPANRDARAALEQCRESQRRSPRRRGLLALLRRG